MNEGGTERLSPAAAVVLGLAGKSITPLSGI